ncbi:MAG: transcriptional repressor LexA [Bryobacteraceae bacterium]|nr:transcriptional repressor LexA [Bryobacteraceae bacterium]MDW8377799.1 transcriptional repressor LexA [Bryobacterales bacterium]
MALTRRQKEVLDFIAQFVEERGYCPSYEEIAKGLNLASLATVHKHIQTLETKQYLRRGFNQSRSLEVSPAYLREWRKQKSNATSPAQVPLLGRIAAGLPVEAIAGDETMNFADLLNDRDLYALQVKGESMIEDHICDGDFVLIERTPEVNDGDIVVALVNGSEATLKRFYREGNGLARLQPANANLAPIVVPMENLQIQGKLLAVLRKYR